MTRTVAIARCKNEADIAEMFLRHTCAHVDHVLVSDDASADRTVQIITKLIAEGLPITLLSENTIGYYQGSAMTKLMRYAAETLACDWVVPLDFDEFIQCPGRLADILRTSPAVAPFEIPWMTYVFDPWKAADDYVPKYRLQFEATTYNKVIVPKAMALKYDLLQGSHALIGQQAVPLEGVKLAHYPIRSSDQYALKATLTYLQYSCIPNWKQAEGFQCVPPLMDLMRDGFVNRETMAQQSQRYSSQRGLDFIPEIVRNPMDYRGAKPIYTDPYEKRFIPCLLKYAESLALKIADAK